MTTSFGSLDNFGLADTNWKAQNSSIDPNAAEGQAPDEKGDILCSTIHGATTTKSTTYLWCGGATLTFPASLTGLGILISTDVVTGIQIETSNTEKPKLTVTGMVWVGEVGGPAQKYTITFPTLAGTKTAQALGFTAAEGTKITSSTWSASAQVAQALDEGGDVAALDLYQGRIEASGNLISCTGTPSATAAASYTLSKGVASASTNTGYATATVSVFKNLAADAGA